MPTESIEELARRLAESLPQGVRAVGDDLERNFRHILKAGLARLDLVTREEFDVQEAVLARTRTRLESLEDRLQQLEAGSGRSAPGKKVGKKKSKATKKKAAAKPSRKKVSKKKKKTAT